MSRFTALMDEADGAAQDIPVSPSSEAAQDPPVLPSSEAGAPASEVADLTDAAAAQLSVSPVLVDPIFFVDLEFTGLDPAQHTILEIAIIVSDGTLSTLIEGPNLCIHHDDSVLTSMNEWSTEQHEKSGLTQRCRESTLGMAEAEQLVCAFIREHADGRAVLGGACVYKDKEFLDAHFPLLRPLLSHRVVDVSSVRELARRWHPSAARHCPRGTSSHRALDDIKYSIDELRYYRDACWKPIKARGQAGVARSRASRRK